MSESETHNVGMYIYIYIYIFFFFLCVVIMMVYRCWYQTKYAKEPKNNDPRVRSSDQKIISNEVKV